jgi:tRNA nucleotidyltransferase (CCA-adding enzyme)
VLNVPREPLAICHRLQSRGHQAYLVGGAVRDSLMGRVPHDWDVATDALPDQVKAYFPKVILTGEKHGTVTVLHEGGSYEVTTFRGDGEYSDGRRPDSVKFVKTIDEDLSRRDFTMNAIAYDPFREVLADPFHGVFDIDRWWIRCVGDPIKRLNEDGLRSLRACRFAATLGFEIHGDTLDAISKTLYTYSRVAPERIRAEWMKTMDAAAPSIAFGHMRRTGMIEVTAPELLPMAGCAQNRYHGLDVWGHSFSVVDAVPVGDPILRMAALFHDIGKPSTKGKNPKTGQATFYDHENVGAAMAETILRRLKFSNAEIERVTHLVRHHLIRYQPGDSKAAIRRWVRKVGLEHVPSLLALARADVAGKGNAAEPRDTSAIDELEERLKTLQVEGIPTSTTQLAINGRDVMAHLGIGPGPRVGEILRALLDAVTEDPTLNERGALLALVDQTS